MICYVSLKQVYLPYFLINHTHTVELVANNLLDINIDHAQQILLLNLKFSVSFTENNR